MELIFFFCCCQVWYSSRDTFGTLYHLTSTTINTAMLSAVGFEYARRRPVFLVYSCTWYWYWHWYALKRHLGFSYTLGASRSRLALNWNVLTFAVCWCTAVYCSMLLYTAVYCRWTMSERVNTQSPFDIWRKNHWVVIRDGKITQNSSLQAWCDTCSVIRIVTVWVVWFCDNSEIL